MNILTFDIEDWFHLLGYETDDWSTYPSRISGPLDKILTCLEQHDLKATFFCLGWIAEQYPELVSRIDAAGHEIGSHSYGHELIKEQGKAAFTKDLKQSIDIIESITSKKVTMYRAPGFSLTEETGWVIEILSDHGIEYDCSISSAIHAHGGISRTMKSPQWIEYNGHKLKCFPLNYMNLAGQKLVCSGGGYFRFFPWWLIKRHYQQADYTMAYFHPKDFDPDQPRLSNLSPFRRFKAYYGLSVSYEKFEQLLNHFDFISVSEADKLVDWESVSSIEFKT